MSLQMCIAGNILSKIFLLTNIPTNIYPKNNDDPNLIPTVVACVARLDLLVMASAAGRGAG